MTTSQRTHNLASLARAILHEHPEHGLTAAQIVYEIRSRVGISASPTELGAALVSLKRRGEVACKKRYYPLLGVPARHVGWRTIDGVHYRFWRAT